MSNLCPNPFDPFLEVTEDNPNSYAIGLIETMPAENTEVEFDEISWISDPTYRHEECDVVLSENEATYCIGSTDGVTFDGSNFSTDYTVEGAAILASYDDGYQLLSPPVAFDTPFLLGPGSFKQNVRLDFMATVPVNPANSNIT